MEATSPGTALTSTMVRAVGRNVSIQKWERRILDESARMSDGRAGAVLIFGCSYPRFCVGSSKGTSCHGRRYGPEQVSFP